MNKRDAKIIALELILEEVGYNFDSDQPWREEYTEDEQEKIEDAGNAVCDALKARLVHLKST